MFTFNVYVYVNVYVCNKCPYVQHERLKLYLNVNHVPNCYVPDEKIKTSNIVDTHGHVDTQQMWRN